MISAQLTKPATLILAAVCGLLSLVTTTAAASATELAGRDWLPEVGRQQLATQLVEAFRLIDDGSQPVSDEEWAARGRRAVDSVALRIEQLGVSGLLENTPGFDQVALPGTGHTIVDAMAAWGACSLPLHRELAADSKQEFYVLLGEVQVVMVSAALRQGLLDAGGTDEQLAQLLRTQGMNDVSYEIQVSEELRAHVNERCGPSLSMLLDPPEE